MPDPLEYDEEEVYEDTAGFNETQPVAGPSSRPLSTPSSPQTPIAHQDPRKRRIEELHARRRQESRREKVTSGVRSLRQTCLDVVRFHQARVWDVGDLEYPVIREFLLGLPREQLEEIESNSKHLNPETDWIWELFLLEDYPTHYERCNVKDGQPRTRGWRRMYRASSKRVREEIEQRQENAKKNLADRYAKMEKERDAKKIQIIDRCIPDKKKRGRGGSSVGSASVPGRSVIAKARSETNRARVAMTHAAGRYVPPATSSRSASALSQPFRAQIDPVRATAPLPRLPPPRARKSPPRPPIRHVQTASARDDIAQRAALPAHLAPRPSAPTNPHFRLDAPPSKYQTIVKPQTESFRPPQKPSPLEDYFGDAGTAPKGLMTSLSRSSGVVAQRHKGSSPIAGKRSAEDSLFITRKKKKASAQ